MMKNQLDTQDFDRLCSLLTALNLSTELLEVEGLSAAQQEHLQILRQIIFQINRLFNLLD
ncbi:MAG: hypothetical protein WBA77_18505 [Microcoleaceae cyanobacterium]